MSVSEIARSPTLTSSKRETNFKRTGGKTLWRNYTNALLVARRLVYTSKTLTQIPNKRARVHCALCTPFAIRSNGVQMSFEWFASFSGCALETYACTLRVWCTNSQLSGVIGVLEWGWGCYAIRCCYNLIFVLLVAVSRYRRDVGLCGELE